MQPQERDLVLKNFKKLVQSCDLQTILKPRNSEPNMRNIFSTIEFGQDKYHKNRCILFKILEYDKDNLFPTLVQALKDNQYSDLVEALGGHEDNLNLKINLNQPLKIDVKLSTEFYDTEKYNKVNFYSTRSKHRGHVLLINNINFPTSKKVRNGALTDGLNLKTLFEQMGIQVTEHLDQTRDEILKKVQDFMKDLSEFQPDLTFIIIMSHGAIIQNQTYILTYDDLLVCEDTIIDMLNNKNFPQFKSKPKILIFHICRHVINMTKDQETQTDSRLNFGIPQRTYSDMLICHPSFQAFRDPAQGAWYIQIMCKIFMEHAHELDVETLFIKVDQELEKMSSSKCEAQTSIYQNIAFKKCYLHPGIYEEQGKIRYFLTPSSHLKTTGDSHQLKYCEKFYKDNGSSK